jgi:TonB family protein
MRNIKEFIIVVLLVMYASPLNVAAQSPTRQPSPEVVKAVIPIYPDVARAARLSGTVVVEVKINPDGSVASTRSVSGDELLYKATAISARRWIFTPADKQTKVRDANLTFIYKLMPVSTPVEELFPIFMPPYQVEIRSTPLIAGSN